MSRSHFALEIVDQKMAETLRQKTPAQRLAIAFGLWRFTRATLQRRLAADHPEWTAKEIAEEVARRMLRGA